LIFLCLLFFLGQYNWPIGATVDIPTLHGTVDESTAFVQVPVVPDNSGDTNVRTIDLTSMLELKKVSTVIENDERNQVMFEPIITTELSGAYQEELEDLIPDSYPANQIYWNPIGFVNLRNASEWDPSEPEMALIPREEDTGLPWGTVVIRVNTNATIEPINFNIALITLVPPHQ